MVKTKKRLKGIKKLAYAILIGLAVVAFWRGAWELMKIYVFPGNLELSAWTTMLAGILILILTHKITKELM